MGVNGISVLPLSFKIIFLCGRFIFSGKGCELLFSYIYNITSLLMRSLFLKCFICVILLFVSNASFSQSEKDSLLYALKSSSGIAKAAILNELSIILTNEGDLNAGMKYAGESIKIAKKYNDKKAVAIAFNSLGDAYYYDGNFNEALKCFEQALKFDEEAGNKKGVTQRLSNIALTYEYLGDYQQAISYHNKALQLSTDIKFEKGKASALGNLGNVYVTKGDYSVGLDYFLRSLKIIKTLRDKHYLASILGNIGNIYFYQADHPKALEYYFEALKINEELKDYAAIARQLSNIGAVYQQQKEYDEALKYYNKALRINERMNNKGGISNQLGNIASIYHMKGDIEKALSFYEQALEKTLATGDINSLSIRYGNIGVIYLDRNEFSKALEYFNKALKYDREIGDKNGESRHLGNIASAYFRMKNYPMAEKYNKAAIKISEEINALDLFSDHNKHLSELYTETGNYKLAMEYYKKHISLRDTIYNRANQKALIQQQFKYDYAKKAAADSVKAADELRIHQADLKAQKALSKAQQSELRDKRNQQYFLFGGLTLLLVFAAFMYNRFRVTKRQKKIIEVQKSEVELQKELIQQQKHIVEEKQKEIIDSINYAQRIQSAILAREDEIKKYLPSSFLFYQPKDIVAGDFYFFEVTEKYIFYAAADCTGHGVPGALVSVVCSNALTRCVKEFNLTETGKILDQARILVLDTFKKSGQDVKDGMDISLLSINRFTGAVSWSGANNPLWFTTGNEMNEIVPDKQPIGFIEQPKPFTTHVLEIKKDDWIFLFTDGYADQFGGPKGKKFKYKNLQELLLTGIGESPESILELLRSSLNKWKGDLEQVDDVCVIGIRV